MAQDKWFSSKLRFVLVVETDGGQTLYERVFLFRAHDFDHAFRRAIKLGLSAQSEYKNQHGAKVVWRFVEIISLDIIMADELDGAEVCSNSIPLAEGEQIPFDQTFSPENSKPIQTI